MNKLLPFIFLSVMLSVSEASAQTNVYHPFPDSNVIWHQGYTYVSGNPPNQVLVTCPQFFFLSGDTLISNIAYKKVFSDGYKYAFTTCCYYYNKYEGAIRQDTAQKKIYCYLSAWNKDTILYDFSNLNLGDTLPPTIINGSSTNYISSIDSVLVGTSYRKQYHISNSNPYCPQDSDYVQLIEGMGSTLGLFQLLGGSPDCGDNGGPFFSCYSDNNMVLYTKPNSNYPCDMTVEVENLQNPIKIYISPNPSTGIFSINSSEKFQFSVYDIFGRDVYQSTNLPTQSSSVDLSFCPKGIYFVRVIPIVIGRGEKIISRKIILQ